MTSYIDVNQFGVAFDGYTHLGLAADGSEKLGGETTACGKWRGAVAQRLARNNFHCRLFSQRDWRRTMFERHAFGVVFNLVGALHGACPAHEVRAFSRGVSSAARRVGWMRG